MTTEAAQRAFAPAGAAWRERFGAWLDSGPVQRAVVGLILLNALVFGLETSPSVMAKIGPALLTLDRIILVVFVAEIAARLIAFGARFFRDAWSVFDFIVVGIALLPATGSLAALRSLRVLRVLRLVSAMPRLRRVVTALMRALPGMASVGGLLVLLLYVAAVIGTKLFAQSHPEYFGDLGASLMTLFQILTLEGWADIMREVMTVHPFAWLFFVPFVLITTFAVLNLVVAVVVDAMQEDVMGDMAEQNAAEADQLARIHAELAEMRALLTQRNAG